MSPLDLRGPGSLGSSHNFLVVSRKDCLVLPASFQLAVSRGNVAEGVALPSLCSDAWTFSFHSYEPCIPDLQTRSCV